MQLNRSEGALVKFGYEVCDGRKEVWSKESLAAFDCPRQLRLQHILRVIKGLIDGILCFFIGCICIALFPSLLLYPARSRRTVDDRNELFA